MNNLISNNLISNNLISNNLISNNLISNNLISNNLISNNLISVRNSLKSNIKSFGPKIYNAKICDIIGNNVHNNDSNDFTKRILEVVYNITPSEYYEY